MNKVNYQKVKRGMVFYYNVFDAVERNSLPQSQVRSLKHVRSNDDYGSRPFLVVSSNEICSRNKQIQVVPLFGMKSNQSEYPNRVYFEFKHTKTEIACDQIYTIFANDIKDYDTTLSDDLMAAVDKQIAANLDIDYSALKSNASMKEIEAIISQIIKQQVEAEKSKQEVQKDNVSVDDVVLEIGQELMDLFDVNSKSKSDSKSKSSSTELAKHIQETAAPISDEEESNVIIRKPNERFSWNTQNMKTFLEDCKRYDADTMVKRYSCSKSSLATWKCKFKKKLAANS